MAWIGPRPDVGLTAASLACSVEVETVHVLAAGTGRMADEAGRVP